MSDSVPTSGPIATPPVVQGPESGPKGDIDKEFEAPPLVSSPSTAALRSLWKDDKPPDIPLKDIAIGRLLGSGGFAEVYLAQVAGQDVALKVPKRALDEAELEEFKHEICMMRSSTHPNVLLFVGYNSEKAIMITEIMDMDLRKFITEKCWDRTSMPAKIRMIQGAVLGLAWLHDVVGIVHRDIKPENFLVKGTTVKVADMGLGMILKRAHRGSNPVGPSCGTLEFKAPEVLNGGNHDFRTDVYAMGLVLFEFFSRVSAYTEFNQDEDILRKAVCSQNYRPDVDSVKIPEDLKTLIKLCWDANPEKRPAMKDIFTLLDPCMVDSVVNQWPSPGSPGQTEDPRAFWKTNFGTPTMKTEIPWKELRDAIIRSHKSDGVTENYVQQLHKIVPIPVMNAIPMVSLERFQFLCHRFGAFFSPGTDGSGSRLLQQMVDLATSTWFRNLDNSEAAHTLFNGQKPGAFIIRYAASAPFAVTYQADGRACDTRIFRTSYDPSAPEAFTVAVDTSDGRVVAPDLVSLVTRMQEQKIVGEPVEQTQSSYTR